MAKQLMRNALKNLYPRINDAHAGLLMQRGLKQWEEGEKPTKKALIRQISAVKPNDFYLLAFNRWLANTYNDGDNNLNFANVSANIEGRLYTGLSTGSTLETSATTHHTYGMPMLAGSSIKGAVRSYAEQHFADKDDEGNILLTEVVEANNRVKKMTFSPDNQAILAILFGTDSEESDEETANSDAGYIIWHDAWWIPDVTSQEGHDSNKPFVDEVVTVHQEKYYQGTLDQALDMENPIPNQQIGIQGAFYFALEGEEEWVALAKELLKATLQHQGMGAKGSSGYGYMITPQEARQIEEERERQERNSQLFFELMNEFENLVAQNRPAFFQDEIIPELEKILESRTREYKQQVYERLMRLPNRIRNNNIAIINELVE